MILLLKLTALIVIGGFVIALVGCILGYVIMAIYVSRLKSSKSKELEEDEEDEEDEE